MFSRIPHILLGAAIMCPGMHACMAQSASAPVSRADVKAQTRAAEKAGQLIPAGEGVSPVPEKQTKSNYTRAERKAATVEARKNGDLVPTGDAGEEEKIAKDETKARSTKTRADRKAETIAARRAGQLIPAGEGPTTPAK
jgi:hypothetical protein